MNLLVVKMADMKIADRRGDVLVTYALGSCLGITAWDPLLNLGGMLHVMLPSRTGVSNGVDKSDLMFVDTAVPLLVQTLLRAGADKYRLQIKAAGGASIAGNGDIFAIGKRNLMMLRGVLWKQGLLLANQDVGGSISRTLFLDVESGRTWLKSEGVEWSL